MPRPTKTRAVPVKRFASALYFVTLNRIEESVNENEVGNYIVRWSLPEMPGVPSMGATVYPNKEEAERCFRQCEKEIMDAVDPAGRIRK